MARTNKKIKRDPVYTHGGAKADRMNAEQKLKRAVMSTMLWEDQFYEGGVAIADRIVGLIPEVRPEIAAKVARDARDKMKLRHVGLLVAREMARRGGGIVSDTIADIVQRPDELSEFLSIYWKDGKQPLAAQVKKGLARAFRRFDEYQLAKWDRPTEIKLRDVMFLTHAKPKGGVRGYTKEARRRREGAPTDAGSRLFSRLVDGTLHPPDTWESKAAAGVDKKTNFTELMKKEKLGGMAFLKNLRGMEEVGVSVARIKDYFDIANFSKALPFRFLTAAKHAPRFEDEIESSFFRTMLNRPKLSGKTILIVDVSGSMYGRKISEKSEMDRAQVACSLAVLVRELCEEPVIYATAGSDMERKHKTAIVPSNRRGFSLSDYIYKQCQPLEGGGIFLKQVNDYILAKEKSCDRVIVITDEEDCDNVNAPSKANPFGKVANYIINVASSDRGIGYAKWVKINGFSEAVLDYILEYEKEFC